MVLLRAQPLHSRWFVSTRLIGITGKRSEALSAAACVGTMSDADAAALRMVPLALQGAYAAAAVLLVLGEVRHT